MSSYESWDDYPSGENPPHSHRTCGKCGGDGYVSKLFSTETKTCPRCDGRGSHMAETTLGPGDSVISDGGSPEEVLQKHRTILPAAILSRALL